LVIKKKPITMHGNTNVKFMQKSVSAAIWYLQENYCCSKYWREHIGESYQVTETTFLITASGFEINKQINK